MSLLVVNEMTLSQSCVSVATPTYFPWEPNPIKSVIICPGEGEPTDGGAVTVSLACPRGVGDVGGDQTVRPDMRLDTDHTSVMRSDVLRSDVMRSVVMRSASALTVDMRTATQELHRRMRGNDFL